MKLLVTGSSGLIGSAVVTHFDQLGWNVHGADNNMRAEFFGPQGETRTNQRRLMERCRRFRHHEVDVRDRADVFLLVEAVQPDAIVHAAAQPSHDLAALRPLDDFDVNATGTLNVIEAARQFTPNAAFVHLSSNKVYGDAPNELPLVELETRWDYARAEDYDGIREDLRIDQSKHSIFGASKVAADVLVQEYGRYYGMKTCCLRGGCLTGPYHSAVELHGFLSYLIKVAVSGGVYKVYGYKGKQVRDNIHSSDVAKFIELYIADPRPAEVYNLGGGRANSCSILEAIALVEAATGRPLASEYVDRHREGDHICYISDLTKMKSHYPGWAIERSLEQMVSEIAAQWLEARTTVS
jgi:CDP-paratose 2-epimerase